MWSRIAGPPAMVLAAAVCAMSFAGTPGEPATHDEMKQAVSAWLEGLGNDAYKAVIRSQDGISPLPCTRINDRLFALQEGRLRMGIGFTIAPQRGSTLEELRATFAHIALDCLPVPGIDATNWETRLQTPHSSFKKGVTLESWQKGVLRIRVQTQFFAAYGRRTDILVPADAGMPEGTYFQIRRPINADLVIECRLFHDAADSAPEPEGGP